MSKYRLKPPFEIYHAGVEIGDADGHICSAENPEIAEAIVAALELAQRLSPSLAHSQHQRGDQS